MYEVTRLIRFCYGHRLLNYAGKCRHLHGHNGVAEITLRAERLDARGMVRDFDEIKRTIQEWIDRTLDHTMLLNRRDPLAGELKARGERHLLLEGNPTAEAIGKLIYDYAVSAGLPVCEVRLWETDQSVAAYRPTDTRVPAGPRAARRGAERAIRARRRAPRKRSISTAA
jgi:6-pyruvoyltetrahydropterin/6-carboxytetrahydropterin synthase